ncbi:MAG TPA: hypothetical protein VF546_11650 [Pyrinomonadaceae bacterium]|jgi:hypothetical protein
MQSKSLPLVALVALVLLCALSWGGYAQRRQTKQPAWEYKTATFPYADEKALNAVGAQGWELVGVSDVAGSTIYFFKRPK